MNDSVLPDDFPAWADRDDSRALPGAVQRHRGLASTRLYEADCLDDRGRIVTIRRRLDIHPFCDAAFTALARGAMIATATGHVAVEDLAPGDLVDTAEAGPAPVQWIGRIVIDPAAGQAGACALYRLCVDALGYNRPMQDLLLGPGARLWSARRKAFRDVAEMVDGETIVTQRAIAPLTLYHLCLAGGPTIMANGLAMQSYQPDADQLRRIKPERLRRFAEFFPNSALVDEFAIKVPQRKRRRALLDPAADDSAA